MKNILLLILISFTTYLTAADFSLQNLKVEYQKTPIGIDIMQPQFSWQMKAAKGERGYAQTAWQIIVTDEGGAEVWHSGKVASSYSLAIPYNGKPLKPTTYYTWQLTVWDNHGALASESSWFETGLMNADPGLDAWSEANWIGGSDEDMVLYSHYLSVFKLSYKLTLDKAAKSTKAAFVFGANDARLMDKDLNIQGVENRKNESYLAFELDISGVDGTEQGLAKLHVYRVGYHPDDQADKPFRSTDIPQALINQRNKYDAHTFTVESVFGLMAVYLDGQADENRLALDDKTNSRFAARGMNLNPVGRGQDFLSFPVLGDIGFVLDNQQKATFSEIKVMHFRQPSNTIFSESVAGSGNYQGIFKSDIGNGLSVISMGYQLTGRGTKTLITADPSRNAAPMLRTTFEVDNKTIAKARLYVTARGIYEMYLNGQRISNDYFNPGLTQYNKTHMYQTYDVTDMISQDAENALGAWLSEGWWSGNITFVGSNWNFFGDRQSLLAKLVVTYEDGTQKVVTSNPREWKYYSEGPIRYGSFFQGEVYDARLETVIEDWSSAEYDDSEWTQVVEIPLKGTSVQGSFPGFMGRTFSIDYDNLQIIGQIGENATVVQTRTAQSVEEVRPGVYVYDMGQNMVGVPQIHIKDAEEGQTITLRYAEVRYPDLPEHKGQVGMVMMENIRAALATDTYIAKSGDQTIQPRFTFHGYRFIEITGINEALPLEDVRGLVISSVREISSSYETSNELVNRLWLNICWSLRGNFLSIPTDTPARNERMGWNGDINVFSRAATYLAQMNPFFKRHMLAMRDMQMESGRFTDVAPVGGGFGGVLWGSAGIIVAWEAYQQFGDMSLLREHYPAMKRYMEFLETRIDENSGILNEGPLGDWLSPEGNQNDNGLLWAAYHIYDLEILAYVAELLDKKEDARQFKKRHAERKRFFNDVYVDKKTFKTIKHGEAGGMVAPSSENNKGSDDRIVDTQASYAIPLAFDVFDDKHKPHAIKHLVETIQRKNIDDSGVERPAYSLMTGFIGTASLANALSENGHDETAYRLLQQTSYPSWLYPVINGATTIWERLNSYTIENGFGGNNSMNSFNHYSFGAVASWMYNYSLGIQRDPERPGFKHFILQPTPDPTGKMSWASGHLDTMYGRITSEWQIDGDKWTFKTTVPANTTATLYLPTGQITEGGLDLARAEGISVSKETQRSGHTMMMLESGSYEFEISQ